MKAQLVAAPIVPKGPYLYFIYFEEIICIRKWLICGQLDAEKVDSDARRYSAFSTVSNRRRLITVKMRS